MKKLYRNLYDSVIAGVCSGFADYLNIDKSLIRIIAVGGLLTCTSFFAVTYIAAWVILPKKNF
ncbi:PspC domain-containing protein [Mollicutes bacterium LVI A0039]|nr:PspC domain-containing protein [Mollicutes bacterium LVI A0039]